MVVQIERGHGCSGAAARPASRAFRCPQRMAAAPVSIGGARAWSKSEAQSHFGMAAKLVLTRWRLHLDSDGQPMDRRHTAAGFRGVPARCHSGGREPPWRFESLWLPPTTSRASPYSRGEWPCWEQHGGLGARRRVRGWIEGLP